MIGVGGYFLLAERSRPNGFTLGMLIMFRAYWWRLFGPIQTLARVNDMVQRAVAAGTRVFEVLDAPDELPNAADARELEFIRGELELRDVSFSYGGREFSGGIGASPMRSPLARQMHGRGANVTVLHGLSLRILPGQTVALCGPSGSG